MKQYITRKQYHEVGTLEHQVLYHFFWPSFPKRETKGNVSWGVVDINPEFLTIGQMIDFLGDDWVKILGHKNQWNWDVPPPNDKLCDELWEAVKQKAKQTS